MARVDCDVLIMGNGIVGNLAAAWFRRHMPALQVNVVGPAASTLPIVGESLVEFSTQLLQEIGLGRHLVEEQLPKYGLTFYYKVDPTAPADPRYVVDAVPANPPLPSFLVNRFTLDDALRQLNRDNDVEHVDGKVVRVELGSGTRHRITVRDGDGRERTHTARWAMDATGRRRLLARQLHLGGGVTHQRSSFWFRLADFDASILDRIDAVTSDVRRPDAYYAAHHFFGRGNWIWLIPVRAETGRQMMSVGLTCRPDLFPEPVTSIPEFLDRVADEHPILGDLVRSGSVVDTNLYRSYMYRTRRRYSSQGWFIVGGRRGYRGSSVQHRSCTGDHGDSAGGSHHPSRPGRQLDRGIRQQARPGLRRFSGAGRRPGRQAVRRHAGRLSVPPAHAPPRGRFLSHGAAAAAQRVPRRCRRRGDDGPSGRARTRTGPAVDRLRAAHRPGGRATALATRPAPA